MRNLMQKIIDGAEEFGLPEAEVVQVQELLDSNECGLSLDILVSQLCEWDIKISAAYFQMIEQAAEKMNLPQAMPDCLRRLIK